MRKEKEDLEQQIKTLEEQIFSLEAGDNQDEFDEFLDDTQETVVILGMSYCPSRVLKELDPIAYSCEQANYNDERITELNNELENLKQELKNLDEA